MNSLVAVYVFITGLCIGSFLNVVILRGLSGEDFIMSRSKCPKCNNQLKWYMNIPLLSYIFLRRKCAFCSEKISIQYPIVEFTTGLMFLAAYLVFGLTFKTLFICIFLSLFIALCTTDILQTVILDYHAYILFATAVLYSWLKFGDVTLIQSVLGAIASFVVLEIIARTGYFISNYRIFGEGDSLIALGLGAIFGFKNFLIIFGLSVLIQSITAIPVLIKNALKNNNKRLIASYIFVLIGLASVLIINYFIKITLNVAYITYIIVLTILLLWSLKNILSSVRNKKTLEFDEAKEKFTIFPFGPAMILAGTLGIFFLKQIKIALKMFLY